MRCPTKLELDSLRCLHGFLPGRPWRVCEGEKCLSAEGSTTDKSGDDKDSRHPADACGAARRDVTRFHFPFLTTNHANYPL